MTMRLLNDEDGELDEVVAELAHVHLERMAENEWCLIITERERKIILNLGAKRATVRVQVFEDKRQANAG